MAASKLDSRQVSIGGVPLSIISDPAMPRGDTTPGYEGSYQTQDSTLSLTRRDVPQFIRRFWRGAGFVARRDEGDDDGYAWCEDGHAWLENGFQPAGRRFRIFAGGINGVTTQPIGSVTFDGHLWFLTNSAGIFRIPNSDPANAPVLEPPASAWAASGGFRAGYNGQSICIFATAGGAPAIYVSTYNTSLNSCRIYQYTAGVWTESAVMPYLIFHLASVWWEGRDGVGAQRLVGSIGTTAIRHVISGQDPMNSASWIAPITVGNPAFNITRLVAAPKRLYVVKENGIHDVTETRTANMTPYWEESYPYSGLFAQLYDDHVYATRGGGLDRLPISTEDQQRIPGECGPMAFMQDGTPIIGYITALAQHDGWLLAALVNPWNNTSYVGRAKDRRTLKKDVPNPLVWHWAECVVRPNPSLNQVTHMRVSTRASGASRITHLWLGVAVDNGGVSNTAFDYVPLPTGSGPTSLLASGGTFEYTPTAYMFHTAQNWGDGNALKAVRRYDTLGSRVNATRTIELRSRADGDPTTITDLSTWISQGLATADSSKIVPISGPTGKRIHLLSILTTPSPYTAAPSLLELSPRAKVIRETFKCITLYVILEKDHEMVDGQIEVRDPDVVFDQIAAAQDLGQQAYVDEYGTPRTVLVEQGITFSRAQIDDHDWRTIARVELSLVA